MGNYAFVKQLLHRWDHTNQAFEVGPNSWYWHMEEDIYFITKLSRRGEVFPQLAKLNIIISLETQLIYAQKYVITNIVEPIEF